MAYVTQNFYSGQKLTDEHMKHIEAGISTADANATKALDIAQKDHATLPPEIAGKADNWMIEEETGLAYLTSGGKKISSGIMIPNDGSGVGGSGSAGTPYAVQYVFQKLTDEQKEQARENIGAGNAGQINLKKYGITEGNIDHKAPYSAAEWEQAYNNFEGIKAALADMAANGQTNIMLPKGTYVVCYQNPNGKEFYANHGWEIVIPAHVTFDLNGSTIRVIFDSNNRNPYDKSTLDPYKLNGKIFAFNQSYHSTIRNGILLGDRYERSFTNSSEKNCEQTYGITFVKRSEHCIVQNMEISGFMGDAITSGFDRDENKGKLVTYGTQTYTSLTLDKNGAEKTGTGDSFVSGYYDLSPITSEGGKEMVIESTYTNKFAVFFYDQNKAFISSAEYEPLDNIPFPNGAAYCRLMTKSATAYAEGATTLELSYKITPRLPQFVTIEHCKIYNNNRGGMSNLPYDVTIRKCEFFENGTAGTEGWPVFGDSTRYAINCEDIYCRKLVITDNYFHDGFHCLLMSGNTLIVDGNKIHNFRAGTGGCLNLMHFRNAVFTNNVVENSATPQVDSRIIALGSDGRHAIVANNIFKFCTLNTCDYINMYDNVFQFERIAVENRGEKPLKNLSLIEDKTIATEYKDVTLSGAFKDCDMLMRQKLQYGGNDIFRISENTSNLSIEYISDLVGRQYNPIEAHGIKIKGGNFSTSLNTNTDWGTHLIEDCTLEPGKNSSIYLSNNGTLGKYTFKRSKVIIQNDYQGSNFMYINNYNGITNNVAFEVLFEDCTIDCYKSMDFINFSLVNVSNITNLSVKVTFKNCVFNNFATGTIPIVKLATGLNADNYHVTWEGNTLNGNWTEPQQLS